MTSLIFNNFVRGNLDNDLNGRFDLPIFSNGFPYLRNWVCNYKGNLKYRTGMEYVSQTRLNKPARLMEFRFNTEQTYLLEFTDEYMRFYTYDANGKFGYVTDINDDILELNTQIPYAAVVGLQKAQNADVMYLCEKSIAPQKLTRTSATAFNMVNANFSGADIATNGNPNSVCFYKGRLWIGGFANKVTTLKASKVAEYENFNIPGSDIKADDALSFTLSEITDPISWIYGGKRNLVVGNPQGISIINGGTVDEPITSTAVNADLANKEGSSKATPTEKDSQMIYVGLDKKKAYSFDYDLVTESFVSASLNLLACKLPQLEEIYYKRDDNNLVYGRTADGQLLTLLYNKNENIYGWFPLRTNGQVISICTVTRPDGKDDLFACVLRNGNYYIERLADEKVFTDFYDTDYQNDENKEKFYRLQMEELKDCNYLDNSVKYENLHSESITFNGVDTVTSTGGTAFSAGMVGHRIVYKTATGAEYGAMLVTDYVSADEVKVEKLTENVSPLTWNKWYISFNTIDDLDDIEGQTQSVTADGGYVGEYVVTDGKITFDREYTSVIVGYKYEGFAKSFGLGMWVNGVNYQTLKKRISQFVIRFIDSAGFSIGTSLDNLQAVQRFNPLGFYDTTPLLMNGDEFIYGYNDNHDKAKSIYLIQDMPLPCNITMVEYLINFERLD